MPEAQDVTLFRKRSVSAARLRLLGEVCVATPPSTAAVLGFGLLSLILLAAAVCAVEVPQRTRAVGVLMPSGGLIKVTAPDTGQITELAVTEGTTVAEGQLLLRIGSDRNAPGRSPISESEIRSLKAELEFMAHARASEQDMKSRQIKGLDDQIELTGFRMAQAQAEIDLQARHVRMLEQRFERMEKLAAGGSLARDALVRDRSAILNAKAISAGLERDFLRISQELGALKEKRYETGEASVVKGFQYDRERERLSRQIGRAEIEAGRAVLAPTSGVVARLNARPGSTCRPGETLMTLYKGDARLEAWLYLPSHKAGRLKAGQQVQLRLDAYPQEIFGTLTAVISNVSQIALLSSDLVVPLPINGPVFEVRASISDTTIEALGSSWPLLPGTSFKADVIRQRYRLYQWLIRSVWSEEDGGYAIVGS